jgi:hypothetical protein
MDPLQTFLEQMARQPSIAGPQYFSPQGSNVGTGKEVGSWTNPFTDAFTNGPRIDPSELQGSGWALPSMGGSPYWRALLTAAGVIQPTPTAANDTISPLMAGARPSHPPSTGVMPGQWHAGGTPTGPIIPAPDLAARPARPTSTGMMPAPIVTMPARPTSTGAMPQPDIPLPPSRPAAKKRIDPKSVDLGNSRFTTFQYQVPNSIRNSPIYTALNLGGSS